MQKTVNARWCSIALATGIAFFALPGTAAADHYVMVARVTTNESSRPSPLLLSSNLTFDIKFDRVIDPNQGRNTNRYLPTIMLTWTEIDGTVHENDVLTNTAITDLVDNGQVTLVGDTHNNAGQLLRFAVIFLSATGSQNIPTLQFGNNASVTGVCFNLDSGFGNSDYVIRSITNKDDGAGAPASASDVAAGFTSVESRIGTPIGNDGLAGMMAALSTASDVRAARDVVTGALSDAVSTLQGNITTAQNNVTSLITTSQNALLNTLLTFVPLYNDPNETVAFPTSMVQSIEALMAAGTLSPGAQIPSSLGGYFDVLPFILARNIEAAGRVSGINAAKLRNATTDLSNATTLASQGRFGSAASACVAGVQRLNTAFP